MQLRDLHIDHGFVADSTTEAEMLEPKSLKLILQVVDVVSQAEQRHRHLTAYCGDLFNTSWCPIGRRDTNSSLGHGMLNILRR